MREKLFAAVLVLGVGSVSVSACQQKKKAPVPAPSSNAKLATPANVDPALLKQLTDITRSCKIDSALANVTCAQGENRHLISEFVANQRSRPAAVATLAHALSDSNPALQTVAANLLNGAFRSPWGPELRIGAVAVPDAKSLLAAALKAPKALARQAVPGAVNAAELAGLSSEVYAELDKADASEIRPLGYRYVMTHGRLGAFGKIQQLAKDNNTAVSFAALEAPRNMPNWDESEKAAVCPWAAELLKDPRPNVASRAAGLLSSCGGSFVDQLLDRGEKTLGLGQFNAGELGPYRELCSAATRRQPGGATEKQCERNRQLLSEVIANKKLDSQTRSMALVSLAYQWPDDKTLKLAHSLEKDADKSLAEHAGRTVKRLEQRKASEKASAAGEKKPGTKPAK